MHAILARLYKLYLFYRAILDTLVSYCLYYSSTAIYLRKSPPNYDTRSVALSLWVGQSLQSYCYYYSASSVGTHSSGPVRRRREHHLFGRMILQPFHAVLRQHRLRRRVHQFLKVGFERVTIHHFQIFNLLIASRLYLFKA